MTAGQGTDATSRQLDQVEQQLRDCQRRLNRYRAALDAGTDPATVTGWINQVTAEQATAQARRAQLRAATRPTLTTEQLRKIVGQASDLVVVLEDAEPAKRERLYEGLRVEGVYDPAERVVAVTADVVSGWFVSETGLEPARPCGH